MALFNKKQRLTNQLITAYRAFTGLLESLSFGKNKPAFPAFRRINDKFAAMLLDCLLNVK